MMLAELEDNIRWSFPWQEATEAVYGHRLKVSERC